jgi:hypothetical protein
MMNAVLEVRPEARRQQRFPLSTDLRAFLSHIAWCKSAAMNRQRVQTSDAPRRRRRKGAWTSPMSRFD